MKLELKYKDVYTKIFPLLFGAVGGSVELQPGINLETKGKLDFSLIKSNLGVSLVFPSLKPKVIATKWIFELDGYINKVDFLKDEILVDIEGMPDLLVQLT